MSAARRVFDWTFRSRKTGKVVVAQWPNPPLWIFIGASALRRFADLDGTAADVTRVVATVALSWWAVDEIVRGENPFRRGAGLVVAGAIVVQLVGS